MCVCSKYTSLSVIVVCVCGKNTSLSVIVVCVCIDRRIQTLIGHKAEISSAQFNWDCSLIATGSMDKTCKLWDVGSGMSADRTRTCPCCVAVVMCMWCCVVCRVL